MSAANPCPSCSRAESELAMLRLTYPFKARVIAGNAYGLPLGKEFLLARRKDGDASPFPIEVFSYAGDYAVYQFREDEVELLAEGGAPP